MDEQRLSALFRDAAGQPPPASFDTDDVVGASRRATARRRSALAGGSLLGLAVLAGGMVIGGQVLAPTPDPPSVASEAGPEVGDRLLEPEVLTPFADPPGVGTDGAPGSAGGCGPADAQLAAGLVAALDGGPAVPFPEGCPRGFRAAGVVLPGGTVYALLGPSAVPPGGGPGTASAPVDGQVLSVVSVPTDPSDVPPRADEVDDIADELADGL